MAVLVFNSREAVWVAYAIVALSLVVEAGTGSRAGATDRVQDRGTKYVLVLVMFAAIAASIAVAHLVPQAQIDGDQWPLFGFGCAVAIGGIVLRRWSIFVLGRFFTREVMVREDHKVVTAGPYRVLRHPVYSGTLLMMLGYGIMLGNWLSLVVITGGVFLAHVPRVLHEERVLERDLGYSYRAFEYRRKRLIPFLW